jgi:DNA-binding LacI/PurR family transcriptional regulator
VGEAPGFGVTSAAVRAGRQIGADFDLVASGSVGLRWLYEPGTWYFDMDHERMGRRAAAELTRLLDGYPSPGAIRVLPELVPI